LAWIIDGGRACLPRFKDNQGTKLGRWKRVETAMTTTLSCGTMYKEKKTVLCIAEIFATGIEYHLIINGCSLWQLVAIASEFFALRDGPFTPILKIECSWFEDLNDEKRSSNAVAAVPDVDDVVLGAWQLEIEASVTPAQAASTASRRFAVRLSCERIAASRLDVTNKSQFNAANLQLQKHCSIMICDRSSWKIVDDNGKLVEV